MKPDKSEKEEQVKPKRRFCSFCQYSGKDRTYRNVPTKNHEDDMLCNLCDTEVQ